MAWVYTGALLDRAETYVALPIAQRRYAPGLAEISSLYSEITGQAVSSCQQCQYLDFLAVVRSYIRQATLHFHPELMADSNYTLAPGFQDAKFVHENRSEPMTAETLTDEGVEFFIKNGYDHAFVKKPAGKASSSAAEGKPLTEKQQRTARFTELFGTAPDKEVTSAQLAEHIEAKEADAAYVLPSA